jgi:hypothetical protein
MIFALIRIVLLALRRARWRVPILPNLRLRPTLLEQLLSPTDHRRRPAARQPPTNRDAGRRGWRR